MVEKFVQKIMKIVENLRNWLSKCKRFHGTFFYRQNYGNYENSWKCIWKLWKMYRIMKIAENSTRKIVENSIMVVAKL